MLINPYALAVAGGGGGGLAIEATAVSGYETIFNPRDMNLPAGIVAGDLLILVMRTAASTTVTTPSGWTAKGSRVTTLGSTYIFAKIASGSEGSVVSVATSGTARTSAVCYRISGAHSLDRVEVAFTGSNTNNPPSIIASWGAADNLFIAVFSTNRSDNEATAGPTNYTGVIQGSGGTIGNTNYNRTAAAHRFLASASDDPDAFSTTGTLNNPHTATVVIGPA